MVTFSTMPKRGIASSFRHSNTHTHTHWFSFTLFHHLHFFPFVYYLLSMIEIGFNKHSISAHAKLYKQREKSGFITVPSQFSSDQWNALKYTHRYTPIPTKSAKIWIHVTLHTHINVIFFSNGTSGIWKKG